MRSDRWICFLGTVMLFVPVSSRAQDPRSSGASPSVTVPPQTQSSSANSANRKKSKHSNDFLVRGTVFTPEGLSFPGAEVRIRRNDEKKFRWHTETNLRGEFAVRVKQGHDYAVVVHAKGCRDQTKTVDAKSGGSLEEFTIRMEREGGAKQ